MIELSIRTLTSRFTLRFDRKKTSLEEMMKIVQKNLEEVNDRILSFEFREI